MAKKIEIQLNEKNINAQLLRSPEIRAICEAHAREIQARCGAGYAVQTDIVKDRVSSLVYADTYEAKRDNLKNNTLLKAVGR